MAQAAGRVRRVLRGVVFDMDYTVAVSGLDFAEMRRVVGIMEGDILAVIEAYPEPERRLRAHADLKAFELAALGAMRLMPGALDLCAFLDGAGVPRGLITRNVKQSVDYFHTHHLVGLPPFAPALSRECHLSKPNPAPLLHCCEQWGIAPAECVIVGDSPPDDIVCGNRAGSSTILLDTEGRYGPEQLTGEMQPTHVATSLQHVQQLLAEHYDLQPPPAKDAAARVTVEVVAPDAA